MQELPNSIRGDSTPESNSAGVASTRKQYKAPLLTTYGSVTKLTQSGSTVTTETTKTSRSSRKPSDFRLKENINRIGNHPLGFGLYLFDYKPAHRANYGHCRQFGVMAQEVELVLPTAVSHNADGFKVVDYAQLGIQSPLH